MFVTCLHINGKNYIGFTSRNPQERWIEHQQSSRKYAIHYALKKYGVENFSFTVIFQSKDRSIVGDMETHFINEYQSYAPTGYNLTLGGDGGRSRVVGEDERKQISARFKGVKKSPESIELRRLKLIGVKRGPASDIRKNKISAALTGFNRTGFAYVTPQGTFMTTTSAATVIGCTPYTIQNRCNRNKNGYSLQPLN